MMRQRSFGTFLLPLFLPMLLYHFRCRPVLLIFGYFLRVSNQLAEFACSRLLAEYCTGDNACTPSILETCALYWTGMLYYRTGTFGRSTDSIVKERIISENEVCISFDTDLRSQLSFGSAPGFLRRKSFILKS